LFRVLVRHWYSIQYNNHVSPRTDRRKEKYHHDSCICGVSRHDATLSQVQRNDRQLSRCDANILFTDLLFNVLHDSVQNNRQLQRPDALLRTQKAKVIRYTSFAISIESRILLYFVHGIYRVAYFYRLLSRYLQSHALRYTSFAISTESRTLLYFAISIESRTLLYLVRNIYSHVLCYISFKISVQSLK